MTDEQAKEVTALCRKLRVPDGPRSRAFGLIAAALAARERAVWLEVVKASENLDGEDKALMRIQFQAWCHQQANGEKNV